VICRALLTAAVDRTKSSRMGWSDISIGLSGPIVSSLLIHFTERWNFIYSQKYVNRQDEGYRPLDPPASHAPPSQGLISGGDEVFRDIHQHFSRHVHRFFGGEDEEQRREPQDEGAHIQLLRRYASPAPSPSRPGADKSQLHPVVSRRQDRAFHRQRVHCGHHERPALCLH